ncbi:MAG: hypothetical protein V3V88_03580 [Dehalococcoidia bacterium]
MANEIWKTYEEGNILYALIFRQSDDRVWNNTDSQFDTYTDVDIDKYDVVLANIVDSDYYSVDYPAAIATEGTYRVQVMLQAGGTIDADADFGIGEGEIYWNGSSEDTLISISGQLDGLTGSSFKQTNTYGPGE